MLGWEGKNGMVKVRRGSGEFVGSLLLVYLFEVIEATSFHSIEVLGQRKVMRFPANSCYYICARNQKRDSTRCPLGRSKTWLETIVL